jgi:hypothetical protein
MGIRHQMAVAVERCLDGGGVLPNHLLTGRSLV